jgi:hypothetical protein
MSGVIIYPGYWVGQQLRVNSVTRFKEIITDDVANCQGVVFYAARTPALMVAARTISVLFECPFWYEPRGKRTLPGASGLWPNERGGLVYLRKVYDPAARTYRVRYAIANILRDRIVNEGAFNVCFEMDNEDDVVRAILQRGLKNAELRQALERSHLVNLNQWLRRHPDFAEAYYSPA